MPLYRRSEAWRVGFSCHGQRVRQSTGTSSKAKAQAFERQPQGRLYDQHAPGHPEEMTLGEAIERFADTVLRPKRRNPDGSPSAGVRNDLGRRTVIEAHVGPDTPLVKVAADVRAGGGVRGPDREAGPEYAGGTGWWLSGVVERVMFPHPETGFRVLRVPPPR